MRRTRQCGSPSRLFPASGEINRRVADAKATIAAVLERYQPLAKSLDRTPPAVARKIFHSIRAPHRMTSVHAGAVDPVHEATLAQNAKEHVVHVEQQHAQFNPPTS